MQTKRKHVIFGLLLAILVAAFALRFANVGNIPTGLYPDEAVNGMDALQANTTGQYEWFYESNNGREGLFINLQAFSLKLFGNSIAALRLWSVIFGTLTVLGVFLLAYELFQNYAAGLIGAYLIAFSYWGINFSRIGFRAIMVPFILTFAFYFLFKGLRTKKFHDFIIGGFIYGLGLHTYIAFRVSPLVLIVLFISLMITRKRFWKEYWKYMLVFAIAMFIAAAPMLLDFFHYHPEHYASRTSEISVLNPAVNQGHLLSTIGRTLGLALAKYNFWGDQNWRQNYPPYPILDPITGIAFLFGFIYIVIKFFHLTYMRFKEGERNHKFDVYVFLLVWFFILLIPEFLANDGNPHALRSIGTLPVVMIIAVIPLMWLINKRDSFGHSFKIFIVSVLVATFVFIGLFNPIKYFFFWANKPEAAQAFEKTMTDMEGYIKTLPPQKEIFVITGNMQRVPVRFFNWGNPNFHDLHPAEMNDIKPKDMDNFVVLFTDFQKDQIINNIESRFPSLKMQIFSDSFGFNYYSLTK